MTRSTTLHSPSPDEIRALLSAQGWTQPQAAAKLGLTVNALEKALAGDRSMRGGLWLLLRAWAAYPKQMAQLAQGE